MFYIGEVFNIPFLVPGHSFWSSRISMLPGGSVMDMGQSMRFRYPQRYPHCS